jgi:aminoglycoside phosphotransferase (APT) family kinase protein
MFKKGDKVRLKTDVPAGEITKMRMDDDGTVWYLMSWNSGQTAHERWFIADEIESAE